MKKHQKKTLFVFIIYIILLSWLVLMKLMPSFDLLPRMRSINLIPFRETLFVNNKINYKDVIYNVLVFIPLGIYLKIIFQKWPIYKIIVTGLLVSTSYESIQYIFAIGCSDIITNTSGTLIGIAIYSLFHQCLHQKTEIIIDIIGLIIEISALFLMTILFIFN